MRDFIVKILTKLGLYKKSVEALNKLKFELQARRMKKYGLEMLVAADKALSSLGIKAFLTYGALLGAYRDHGFISYDPDIDLGILSDEAKEEMHETMRKAGFALTKQIVVAGSGQVAEETYIYKKLHLDIFFYMSEGDDLYSIIQRRHETKDWKEANVTDGFPCDRSYVPMTDFERRDFLGLKVYMPVKTDQWLRDIYSDSYMTPVKNWDAKGYRTRIVHSDERTYRKYF